MKYYHILFRHLNGESSPAEDQDLYVWLNKSRKNRKRYAALRNLFVFTSLPKSPVSETEARVAADEIFSKEKILKKQRTVRHRLLFAACLAGLLLTLPLAYSTFLKDRFFGKDIVLCSGTDSVKFFTLPDNTRLTLNKNSLVKYSKKFGVANRKIYAEGEVLFEVTPMAEMPFVLSTKSDINIKVLGTTFLLNDANKCFATVLFKGKVKVLFPQKMENDVSELCLLPMDRLTVNDDNSFTLDKIDCREQLLQWRTDALNFENTPLKNILKVLSAYYNRQFSCDPDLEETMLTINLTDKTPDEFIDLVECSLSIDHVATPTAIRFRKSD